MSPPGVSGAATRSASPKEPKRFGVAQKKASFESSVTIPIVPVPQEISVVDGGATNAAAAKEPTETVNKYDNTSDNGSEISDEGYRSLGLIQNGTNKRASMHSQASNEDADNASKCIWIEVS